MALIKCPECGKEISDKAATCPNCGFPVRQYPPMQPSVRTFACQGCGRQIPTGSAQCNFCGFRYAQAGPVVAQKNPVVPKFATKHCRFCNAEMPDTANICPHCHKNQDNTLKILGIIFLVLVVTGIITSGIRKAVEDKTVSNINESADITTETDTETVSEENTEPTDIEEPEKQELTLQDEIDRFQSGEYLFITNEDLSRYCANMEGVKVYVVTEIDGMYDDSIQSTLAGGYMMSDFHVGNNFSRYEASLSTGDLVAMSGVVDGYNSYGFMGKSVNLEDCQVFAVGEDARVYQKDTTDEGLSEYLIVTNEVADSNEEISEEEFKTLCESLNYEDILRNPDSNKGKYCIVKGRVDQVIEGLFGSYTIFVSDSSGNKWGCVYSYKDGESHILEGDKVTFYGECRGTSTTRTVLGKQVTLPDVSVKYID